MSSKTDPSRSKWSLVARLTVWYSALAIILVSAVTAYSYWMLTSNLDLEDDGFVTTRLADVAGRLRDDDGGLDSLERLWREESSEASPLRILIRVLGEDGTVLAAMQGVEDAPWPEAPFRGSMETEEWRFLAKESGAFLLQAALDRRQEAKFLSRYRRQLYLVLFVAAVASAAGGVLLARAGLRPLQELSSVAAGIGANRLQERLDPSRYASELKQVATTFNGMLDRLQKSFQQLERFSGDIAHELRTPLQNLRGEVEVALSHRRSEDEYRDVLGSCLEEAARLSRLVDSLLFLARAEQPQAALKKELLNVNDELRTLEEFYGAVAEDAGVRLSIVTDPNLQVAADRTLFQRAIGNLITNALAHTRLDGGVEIRGAKAGSNVVIYVSDTGVGIPPDQLPFVFDRLFRGAAESALPTGHGLGLSIVRTIVELHGGSVSIRSRLEHGTNVETTWPVTGCHFPSVP